MNEADFDLLEIEPSSPATSAIIWLHGLGADKHDFEAIVPELGLQDLPTRFVFPNAPMRAVTINAGQVMRAWYDIQDVDIRAGGLEEHVRESERILNGLVEREVTRGIAHDRIVVAGFSQGGAVALHTGVRYPGRLAGVLALSTYLPLAAKFSDERHPMSQETPIFMAHGQIDPLIPIQGAVLSRQALEAEGYTVEWHEYPMAHQVCLEEIEDASRWLRSVLS